MKSEQEIKERLHKYGRMLKDALGENLGDWDAEAIQEARDELRWVLE